MKKRKFLLIFMIILFINFINLISASYTCSNESSVLTDQDEIETGEKKSINGLGIGLIDSDETPVFNRFTAEIIVDAKKILLSNETPLEEVELLSGDYSVNLTDIMGDTAVIKVEGNSESVNEGEWTTINNLKVFLVNSQGSYPGQGNAEIMVGIDLISLSNDENPIQIVTINEKNYVLELFSASDTNAIIIVKKCETGNITEDEDSTEVSGNLTTNLITENLTLENSSISENSTTINQSEQAGDNQNLETNESSTEIESNKTKTNNKNISLKIPQILKGKSLYISIFFIMVLIIVVIFLIIHTQNKNTQEAKELINAKNLS